MRKTATTLASLTILLTTAADALAQCQTTPLIIGIDNTGGLTSADCVVNPYHNAPGEFWTVTLEAGDFIVVTMRRTTMIDPYLIVLDPSDVVIALNDDDPFLDSLTARVTFTAMISGVYRIVATSYRQLPRTDYGTYTIRASGVTTPAPPAGRVSGRVTQSGTGAPAVGVRVHFARENLNGGLTGSRSVVTDASGNYVTDELPDGTYYARTSNELGLIDEIYDNVPCLYIACNWDLQDIGRPIVVTAGVTTTDVNFALDTGGRISGRVTDAAGAPRADVRLNVFNLNDQSNAFAVTFVRTDISGNYITGAGLRSGMYFVGIDNDITASCWCPNTYEIPANVQAGATTTGVNFTIVPGGTVSGTMRPEFDVPSIATVAEFYSSTGTLLFRYRQTSSSSGSYQLNDVPPGTYFATAYAVAHDLIVTNPYYLVQQLFKDRPCPGGSCVKSAGTPITVTPGATTSNIEFRFPRGGRISGRVTSTVTGAALASATVRFNDSSGALAATATSDSSGVYLTAAVPTGTYFAATAPAAPIVVSPGQRTNVDVALPPAPGPPRNLRAIVSDLTITLEWDPPLDATGLESYVVEAGPASGSASATAPPVTSRQLIVSSPGAGVYFVRVRSVVAGLASAPSNEIMVIVGEPGGCTLPGPLGVLTAHVVETVVHLSWGAPATGGAPSDYLVVVGRAPGMSDLATIPIAAAATSFSSPAPPGTYWVRIVARNGCGAGPPSNEVSITVAAPP